MSEPNSYDLSRFAKPEVPRPGALVDPAGNEIATGLVPLWARMLNAAFDDGTPEGKAGAQQRVAVIQGESAMNDAQRLSMARSVIRFEGGEGALERLAAAGLAETYLAKTGASRGGGK